MADTLTPSQRHSVMSKNRPRGTRSTERALRARLAADGIRGWRMHASDIIGHPDFVFHRERLILFVDGCFWHKCPKHRTIPATNHEFWQAKIDRNAARDRNVGKALRKEGWHVLRIWEHDMRSRPTEVVARVRRALRDTLKTKAKVKHTHA